MQTTRTDHTLVTQKKQVKPTVKPILRSPLDRFLSGAHRSSTRAVGKELWRLLQDGADGAAVVNISELARRSGYSWPTINLALGFFKRSEKVLPIGDYHTGQGHPGRPMKYRLNPTFTAQTRTTANSEEKGVSSKRLNPSYQTPQEDQKQELPTGSESIPGTVDPRLTDWLRSKKGGEKLRERRDKLRLAVLIRRRSPPILAGCLCEVLFSRQGATFEAWRWLLRMLWRGGEVPGELRDNRKRLVGLCRVVLELAGKERTWPTLTAALIDAARPSENALRTALKRNWSREAGRAFLYRAWKAEALETGACPWCEEAVTRFSIEGGKHKCVRWFFYLEEELLEERRLLMDALFQRQEEDRA